MMTSSLVIPLDWAQIVKRLRRSLTHVSQTRYRSFCLYREVRRWAHPVSHPPVKRVSSYSQRGVLSARCLPLRHFRSWSRKVTQYLSKRREEKVNSKDSSSASSSLPHSFYLLFCFWLLLLLGSCCFFLLIASCFSLLLWEMSLHAIATLTAVSTRSPVRIQSWIPAAKRNSIVSGTYMSKSSRKVSRSRSWGKGE